MTEPWIRAIRFLTFAYFKSARFIEQQVTRGGPVSPAKEPSYTELVRGEEDEKVQFCMDTKDKPKQTTPTLPLSQNPLNSTGQVSQLKRSQNREQTETPHSKKPRKSALEEIKSLEENRQESQNRRENWLQKGLVVKVRTDKLGDKYCEKKGVVIEVEDRFVALVSMTDSGDVIRMDQLYLETVIPNIGREVLVVNGANRGHKGRVLRVSPDRFSVDIEMLEGALTGTEVKGLEYEDVCKLFKDK